MSIRYLNQNYLDSDVDGRFDLILMIMCDFSALGPDQRRCLLQKFRDLLEPGGNVLLDVHSLSFFDKCEESARFERNLLDGFWSPDQYYGFLNTFKYDEEKVTLDKYTIIEAARTRTVYNWLQHFTPETLKEELAACGLVIDAVYADVAGSPYFDRNDEFAVIARKP